MGNRRSIALPLFLALIFTALTAAGVQAAKPDRMLADRVDQIVDQGKDTFRFDTFGDERFWTDALHLNQAIAGAANGGVGPGLSPSAALGVGLKVDIEALPMKLVQDLKKGKVNLNDPAVTLQLIQLNAVIGIQGTVSGGTLQTVGITCALCHTTVDNSLTFGVGQRLDGFANRDLNPGAIIAFAPTVQPLADLLGTDEATVREVLTSWGPGKFDAELFLDGKAFNPQQITDGVVTGTNVPGATLIPNAFSLAGYNQHTWTGAWGTIPYWNALVANLEMGGVGRFFDPRLNDAAKFPIAAAHGFGNIMIDADSDLITKKLPALQVYQLVLPAPNPTPGVDFDQAAADRGDALFGGKAGCVTCHAEPLWTEPGWNLHPAADIGIDAFQADRGPDNVYKTMNLAGLFVRERGLFMAPENKGRFYHDGRFATLMDVVNHYNTHFNLGLTQGEKSDLIEYLKSLGDIIDQASGTTASKMGPARPGDSQATAEPSVTYGPNPFNPLTKIAYRVPSAGRVSVVVYDAQGREVETLVNEDRAPGIYQTIWNANGKPSGVYFYRVKAAGLDETRKLVLVK